jgi:hypothetical protein
LKIIPFKQNVLITLLLKIMETVILDIDVDFESSDTLNKKGTKQDVMKTLAKYHEALVKAASVINLLRDNIYDDEKDDLELFVDDNDKLCVRATSELAERFVCFGIADYDEYACESDEDEDEGDEEGDEDEDKSKKEETIEIDLDESSDDN